MRKDYMPAADTAGLDETDAVERHWTQIWEREGGPKNRADRIPRQAEYRIMRPYLDRLGPGARLLDGGCGLGDWTVRLTEEGFSTVGLDISASTVAKLADVYPDCTFAAGDIRNTGLEDASFDGYFSWGVFEHFEDGPQGCIREAHRLLKPGGWLFISTPQDNLRHALRGLVSRTSKTNGAVRFYQYRFTKGELARELNIGGFEVDRVVPIHKRMGVMRSLHHEFGFSYDWFITKGLSAALAPVVPGSVIAHMIMAVARKPVAGH